MYYTDEEAKREITSRWKEFYPPSKDGKGIICPICGHGSNGDGLQRNPHSQDPFGLHCFGAKCGFSGNVLDLFIKDPGLPSVNSFRDALEYGAGVLNLIIENGRKEYIPAPQKKQKEVEKVEKVEEDQNITEYYKQCQARLTDSRAVSYLQARGISTETAKAYGIGFDPAADPAQTGKYKTPRIIIPVTERHYIARSTDPEMPKAYAKMNNKGAEIGIFNLDALYTQDTHDVFVTEGAFDAISVIEAGAAAIALNSASNTEKLLDQLKKRPIEKTEKTLILCLDNDAGGKGATSKLKEGLSQLDIEYIEANISGHKKDPNEYLTEDREGFIAAVEKAREQTADRPDNVRDYIDRIMSGEIEQFKEGQEKKTGYTNLDDQAGGLYSGLYVIAAISSLGKTTFAAQMADQIAAAGHDVIFFSLEQSRLELVSKSLARITAQNDINSAVSSLAIRRGWLPENVIQAAEDYTKAVEDRLSIVEGNFSCNVSFIGDYVRRYMKRTGSKPVIFIDYLQILQGESDKRQTTKELVDMTVTELKRLSRELDITVFVISSVNRANYLTPIDFESLKESGGIEFTADVIWGLQLQCLNKDTFDKKDNIKERRAEVKAVKMENPRKIELVCLKNRYGISSFSCCFDYDPAHDWFKPSINEENTFDYMPESKKWRNKR